MGPPERKPFTSRVWVRYLAFQLPGAVLASLAAYAAHRWLDVAGWLAGGALAGFLLLDVVAYPFVRIAYEERSGGGVASLVGAVATAQDSLEPSGYVRLGSELWRAERGPQSDAIAPGDRVRVVAVRGLTLEVERVA